MDQPQTITIDDVVYDFAKLSDKAKELINNLTAIDQELASLATKTAISQLAFNTLKAQLDPELASYEA